MSTEEQFLAAIIESGLTPPDSIIADGKMHSFASDTEHADEKGWYVLHADCVPTGAFGCFRRNIKVTKWHPKGHKYSAADRAELKRRMAEIAKQTKAEKEETEAAAATRATNILNAATEAPVDHKYLVIKGVKPHGLFTSRLLKKSVHETVGV